MNRDLIKQFRILQSYYQWKGDKGRSIAYTKICSLLRMIDHPIKTLDDVAGVKGIGPQAKEKIDEFLTTGKIAAVQDAEKELAKQDRSLSKEQATIKELSTVWGIGPAKAKKLYDEGMRTVDQLRRNTHLLTDQQKIGLKYHADLQKRVPRDMIMAVQVLMIYFLNEAFGDDTYTLTIAGSFRRGAKDSGDVDCLITTDKFKLHQAVSILTRAKIITDTLTMKGEKFMGIAHCPGGGMHFRLDIEFVRAEEYGPAVLYFTGSKEFNVFIRGIAKKKGYLLNEHGLYSIATAEKALPGPSEEDIFAFLELEYVPPERR